MKSIRIVLGLIILISSFVIISCNSPESDAKKAGKLYEKLLIVCVSEIDHNSDKWEVEYEKASEECDKFDDQVREKHRDNNEYMMDYNGELMNIMRELDTEYKNKYPDISFPK